MEQGSLPLRDLLAALDTAVRELVDAPAGDDLPIASVALADAADLAAEHIDDSGGAEPVSDLVLHAGVPEAVALAWFAALADRPPQQRPRAVMTRAVADWTPLRAAARRAGVALVGVDPRARWDHVLPRIQRLIDAAHHADAPSHAPDALATDTDLFGLAQMVADATAGMVSIEDDRSHVLAYSPSDETADELRTQTILGRAGPPAYLAALRRWGVYERIRGDTAVVDVPEHPELSTRHRLVIGVHQGRRWLGAIWVQEGAAALAADSDDVLRGAAAIAGRVMSRAIHAPSTEGLLVQRLFGAHGGVDAASAAAYLQIPVVGPAAVIGFTPVGGDPARRADAMAAAGAVLRLRANSYRPDSATAVIGDRGYVLLPQYTTQAAVTRWVASLAFPGLQVRAAIACGVPGLEDVAAARTEVDRVLDADSAKRVTTLAESRTAVLLGEILDLVARHDELRDPRVAALADYDAARGGELRASVAAFLAAHGNVRDAADSLGVHPNTLRYRVGRAESILEMDLSSPADRLLLEIQLAVRRHR